MAYGDRQQANFVSFEIKSKKDNKIDPHFEVSKPNKNGDWEVIDRCSFIEGELVKIDTNTVTIAGSEKKKIVLVLFDKESSEMYMVKSFMSRLGMDVINKFLGTFAPKKDQELIKPGVIHLRVYCTKKEGADVLFPNIYMENDKEKMGWMFDWKWFESNSTMGDEFRSYKKAAEKLWEQWLGLKKFLEEKYPEMASIGQDAVAQKKDSESESEPDMPEPEGHVTETPSDPGDEPAWQAMSEDEDDLPF